MIEVRADEDVRWWAPVQRLKIGNHRVKVPLVISTSHGNIYVGTFFHYLPVPPPDASLDVQSVCLCSEYVVDGCVEWYLNGGRVFQRVSVAVSHRI